MTDKDKNTSEKEDLRDTEPSELEGEEKLEIEDILEREDIDLDEVISEEKEPAVLSKKEDPEKEEEEEAEAVLVPEALLDKKTKEAELPEKKDEQKELKKRKPLFKKIDKTENTSEKKSKKKWFKTLAIVILTALITTAIVLGSMYFLEQRNQNEEVVSVPAEETETPIEPEERVFYINSAVGLNMREEAEAGSRVLALIPFGTKLPLLEEKEGWLKTEFEGKSGWVSAEFTTEKNPLVYENEAYFFKITFNPRWAGYRFIEMEAGTESTVAKGYYVVLPTTERNWRNEGTNIPSGFALLFALGIYEKAEWEKMAETEGPKPAKIGESERFVYTYLPAQSSPRDLLAQFNEIDEVIKTFEIIKR